MSHEDEILTKLDLFVYFEPNSLYFVLFIYKNKKPELVGSFF